MTCPCGSDKIETWLPIPTTDKFEVSNYGRVRAVKRIYVNAAGLVRTFKPKEVRLTDNGRGYKLFCTFLNGKKKNNYIHRVVATLFVPNPNCFEEVNHEDGNKSNNCACNLTWVTSRMNRDHAVVNDLMRHGEASPQSKLNESQVIEILNAYKRDPNLNQTHLGRLYGVRGTTILKIVRGIRWMRVFNKWSIEQGYSIKRTI